MQKLTGRFCPISSFKIGAFYKFTMNLTSNLKNASEKIFVFLKLLKFWQTPFIVKKNQLFSYVTIYVVNCVRIKITHRLEVGFHSFQTPWFAELNAVLRILIKHVFAISMLSPKQVPRGYIRCDYFKVTHRIIVYNNQFIHIRGDVAQTKSRDNPLWHYDITNYNKNCSCVHKEWTKQVYVVIWWVFSQKPAIFVIRKK